MIRLVVLLTFLLVGCAGVKNWQVDYPDNMLEEMVEKIIKEKYGKDIDLTPFTGEEKLELDGEERNE